MNFGLQGQFACTLSCLDCPDKQMNLRIMGSKIRDLA